MSKQAPVDGLKDEEAGKYQWQLTLGNMIFTINLEMVK